MRAFTVMPVLTPLPAAALGVVFGRDHVVHVAVAPGRLAESTGASKTARLCGMWRNCCG